MSLPKLHWSLQNWLHGWAQVRRYAVPRSTIERCAEARAAGDWLAACRASHMDVEFTLSEVVRRYGRSVADRLEADLHHFAPDLVRWHVPWSTDDPRLAPDLAVTLACYGEAPGEGPCLVVYTPAKAHAPQRLRLAVEEEPPTEGAARHQWWTASRHLWHVQHVDELRARWGGGDRSPFHDRDGRRRDAAELPTGPCPDDPAANTEWIVTRYYDTADARPVSEVFAAAGIVLEQNCPKPDTLGRPWAAIHRIAAEALALRDVSTKWTVRLTGSFQVVLDVSDPTVVRGRTSPYRYRPSGRTVRVLPESAWCHPPDLDLLRYGLITPDELHPLVCQALFPDRPPAAGPPPPQPPAMVRVRCQGKWHEIRFSDGQLVIPHSDVEERREQTMAAFVGASSGCFGAKRAWVTGDGRLPRRLREQRTDLFRRMRYGDTQGVLTLLDAGVGPAVRDAQRRTLLHLVHLVDHEAVLPRLLAAGLDVNARDYHGYTPLHMALRQDGSPEVIRALLDAGAAVDAVDGNGMSVADLVEWHTRKDELGFLLARYQEAVTETDDGEAE